MQTTPFVRISLMAMAFFACTSAALAGASDPQGERETTATLVETVRRATQRFHNVAEATAAGHRLPGRSRRPPGCAATVYGVAPGRDSRWPAP